MAGLGTVTVNVNVRADDGLRVERRYTQRAAVASDAGKIAGLAAVYFSSSDAGTQYELWEDTYERIMPGAFDRALRELQDVRALFNHNPSFVLGRTKAGTLRLSVTAEGLAYEIDTPDNTAGRDVSVSIGRGDVTGSSFAFLPRSTTWREESGKYIREINDVDLFDVGPVTYPAYVATAAGLRAMGETDDARSEFNEYIENNRAIADAISVRARIVDLSLRKN